MQKAYPYIFDIDEWRERITISDDSEIEVDSTSGPYDVLVLDSAPESSGQECDPVDLFVWEIGEPDMRHATKIGGSPYRPAQLPWPTFMASSGNEPMVFLAQFCFTNQPNIFESLPGDVMLIFTEGGTFCSNPHFEWYDFGIPDSDLINGQEVPDTTALTDPFVTCFGHVHRTDDSRCGCNSGKACTKIGGAASSIPVEIRIGRVRISGSFYANFARCNPRLVADILG